MVPPALQPPAAAAYHFGYGSFCVISTSATKQNMPAHTSSCCKTENSISPPSSPCSSHSSLSLEPLTSSPSSSSCLHAETFCYSNPLSSSYAPSPLLDHTPSSPTSSLCASNSQHSLKKRLALCQLDDVAPPKRLCDMDVYQNPTTSSDSGSSLFVSDQFASISHRNELVLGGGTACAGLSSTGDLDDVLDLLLQGADAMPTSTSMADMELVDGGASMIIHPELADARIRCPIFSLELQHCKEEEGNDLIESKPSDKLLPMGNNVRPHCASNVDALKELSMNAGDVRSDNVKWGLHMKGQELEDSGMGSFCEEWWRQSSITNTELSSCAQHNQQKESNSTGSAAAAAATATATSTSSKCNGSRWAGPTLMDIESALAMTSSPTTNYPPLVSSPFGKTPYLGSSYLCSLKDILNQETTSFLTRSSSSCKEEPTTLEEDDRISTWRRLQKRNQMEPRYTVKIRCEDDAVNDGYRWRKYGQKSIKNSPHPRSYYRCSSGKCGVKKQVERSSEDAAVLVVSYEGIHLHHRPTLPTPSQLHTCASAAPTCDGPPPPTITDSNKTSTTLLSHLLHASPLSHTSSNSS